VREIAIDWLKDLFALRPRGAACLTIRRAMANYTALAAAGAGGRRRHGVDIDAGGFAVLPAVPVLSSGYIHPAREGARDARHRTRNGPSLSPRDDVGRVDLRRARGRTARSLSGEPAIIVRQCGRGERR